MWSYSLLGIVLLAAVVFYTRSRRWLSRADLRRVRAAGKQLGLSEDQVIRGAVLSYVDSVEANVKRTQLLDRVWGDEPIVQSPLEDMPLHKRHPCTYYTKKLPIYLEGRFKAGCECPQRKGQGCDYPRVLADNCPHFLKATE